MLENKTNLKKVHFNAFYFTNKVMKSLLKHSETLRALCLKSNIPDYPSFGSDQNMPLSTYKVGDISKFVNLEKLNLKGSIPLEDKNFYKIVQGCPKINHLKLGKQLK